MCGVAGNLALLQVGLSQRKESASDKRVKKKSNLIIMDRAGDALMVKKILSDREIYVKQVNGQVKCNHYEND